MTGFRSSKSTPHISDEEMQEEIMACLHAEDWLMVKNEFGGLDWEEINAKLCDMFPQEDSILCRATGNCYGQICSWRAAPEKLPLHR
jgi:hypothetical protein